MPRFPEKRKILITVRTYPTPATKGIEVSCTAGITEDRKWIRLFPLPYRFLRTDQRFRKYQWIEAMTVKASDSRPESYNIDFTSIAIISDTLPTSNSWKKRKESIDPLVGHCLCCIMKERNQNKFPTLGVFKPRTITELFIEPDDPTWTVEQLMKLRQEDLLENAPIAELEKIPYKFGYSFKCDHIECPSHNISCTDWEMGQSYRKWRDTYGVNWESKFRERYEFEMIHKYDTYFYVGTLRAHPHRWNIVGLFYPPLPSPNLSLF